MNTLQLFDSHAHLQDERLQKDIAAVIERAQGADVAKIVCCGTEEKDWNAVADLARKYASVIPCFGVHPWFVNTISEHWGEKLVEYLNKIPSAIGECGLDFAIHECNREVQEQVFKQQVLIAKKMSLPISMHCRKAWERFIDILKRIGTLPGAGLIHSYSGSHDLIPLFENMGLYISFSGTVTNQRSVNVHTSVKTVSNERLLVETDSPDLLPYTIEAREKCLYNEPAYLAHVVRSVAHHREASAEEISSITCNNAMRLFSGRAQ